MLRSEDNFQVLFVSSGVRCRGSKLRFSGLMKKKIQNRFYPLSYLVSLLWANPSSIISISNSISLSFLFLLLCAFL